MTFLSILSLPLAQVSDFGCSTVFDRMCWVYGLDYTSINWMNPPTLDGIYRFAERDEGKGPVGELPTGCLDQAMSWADTTNIISEMSSSMPLKNWSTICW